MVEVAVRNHDANLSFTVAVRSSYFANSPSQGQQLRNATDQSKYDRNTTTTANGTIESETAFLF